MRHLDDLNYLNDLDWPSYSFSILETKTRLFEVNEEGGNLSSCDFALYPHGSVLFFLISSFLLSPHSQLERGGVTFFFKKHTFIDQHTIIMSGSIQRRRTRREDIYYYDVTRVIYFMIMIQDVAFGIGCC